MCSQVECEKLVRKLAPMHFKADECASSAARADDATHVHAPATRYVLSHATSLSLSLLQRLFCVFLCDTFYHTRCRCRNVFPCVSLVLRLLSVLSSAPSFSRSLLCFFPPLCHLCVLTKNQTRCV